MRKIIRFVLKNKLKLQIIFAVIIFILAALACYHLTMEIKPGAVLESMKDMPLYRLGLAVLATLASYIMLFGYEWGANKYTASRVPLRSLIKGSFCAFAVGNTLGFPIFSGGAVRYRVYSPLGVSAINIAKMSIYSALSFAIFLPLLLAIIVLTNFSLMSGLLEMHNTLILILTLILFFLYVVVIGYYILKHHPHPANSHVWRLKLKKQTLELPNGKHLLSQFMITTLDVTAAGTVLYLFLPTPVPFAAFLVVYFVALTAGIISHIPGGIGIFEAIILAAFAGTLGMPELAAALVLYRLVYVLIPFLSACVILSIHEGRNIGK